LLGKKFASQFSLNNALPSLGKSSSTVGNKKLTLPSQDQSEKSSATLPILLSPQLSPDYEFDFFKKYKLLKSLGVGFASQVFEAQRVEKEASLNYLILKDGV
jgi:hypothetical protein